MSAGNRLRLLRLLQALVCLYMVVHGMEQPVLVKNSHTLYSKTSIENNEQQLKSRVKRGSYLNYENLFKNISNDVIRNISIDLFHLCTDTQFCKVNTTAISSFQYGEKCCLKCSCDSECVKTGTCCADIQSSMKPIVGNYDQPPTDCLPVMGQDELDRKRYDFVRTCRSKSSLGKPSWCEGLQQLAWPVYDFVNHVHYWDLDCAECNNVTRENLVMWPKLYRCSLDTGNSGPIRRKRDISTTVGPWECDMGKFVPPLEARHDSPVCKHQIVKHCNQTGLWSVYDQTIEKACEVLDMRYDRLVGANFYSYKNVFCAICNGVDPGMKMEVSCYDYLAITIPFYFMVLHKDLPSSVTEANGNPCQSGQMMDPITTLCKSVHCGYPLQLDSSGKKCIDSLYHSRTDYTVTLSIDLHEPITVSEMKEESALFIKQLELLFPTSSSNRASNVDVYLKTTVPYSTVKFRTIIWESQQTEHVAVVVVAKQVASYGNDVREGRSLTYLNRMKTAITTIWNASLSAHGISFSIADVDTGILPTRREHRTTLMHTGEEPGAQIVPYLFEDLYDYTATIGIEVLTSYQTPFNRQSITIFSKSFIGFPTFLYEMKAHNITREPNGIHFIDKKMTFGFDEFRSVNVSHVHIRIDSVVKTKKVTSAGHYPCCQHVLICIMAVLVVFLYC